MSRVLLVALSDAAKRRAEREPDAEDALRTMIARARQEQPDLELADETLAAWVGDRVTADEAFSAAVRACSAGHLLLACACLRGDDVAIARLDELVARETASALGRIRTKLTLDEARQLVITKLLVGEDEQPPKLSLYRGQGDIRAWLRVVATRLFLNSATRGPKETPLEDRVLDAIADGGDDPDLLYLKRLYREELKQAFTRAVATLAPRDRALLRFALVDELTVDEIGKLYDVHRATAARWVQAAREALEKATHRQIADRLRVDEAQLRSIVRLVRSQLDVSLTRVLGEEP